MTAPSLNLAWKMQLTDVVQKGRLVEPRGLLTKELPQKTLVFDMNFPVVTIPERKLGYRFMAAEAWWILSGRNDVASIAPYSKQISQFSDDGETFFGSYGIPFVDQLPYVVRALQDDLDTRQATMTLWRPNPPKTKDVPCTVAVDFKLRNGLLNVHVFMRSSDNWLGIPYDAFNFTMMACYVLECLNQSVPPPPMGGYRLGTCFLTAASSHLYERNWAEAEQIVRQAQIPTTLPVPASMMGIHEVPNWKYWGVIEHLEKLKDTTSDEDKHLRWWVPR